MLESLICDDLKEEENSLIGQCGPVFFKIDSSIRDIDELLQITPPTRIYTLLEEDLHLVGFFSEERRKLYQVIRGAPGIGRSSALLVLSQGEVRDILRACAGADKEFFKGIPGLGPKRISALITHTKKAYSALPKKLPIPVSTWVEARDSLLTRTDNEEWAEQLLFAACSDHPDSSAEELIQIINELL